MSCAACGHDNRAGAKFCDQCGAPLGRRPAREPAAAPAPRDYTPRHIAERILTARAAVQGERKAVTVLFADVQGSMALAEQVDAEEWHVVMNQFFALLSGGVHRFEGTVNQYTGDGIMALFGAPLAHEDHAQRACHAALHLTGALREYAQTLRRERGLQFSVRMGLNSGEVVVGAIGDDLRMDYTAQGHTVGLAARMEQLCEPGRVYLTERTAALVAGYFELEDLGSFTIKGVREPLRVYALLGLGPLRTRLDVARARGLSRFIGRTDELALLEAAFEEAAGGHAAMVGIVAEAGVGKSRLCVEFRERCRRRGADVVETHALAHGAALPYLPVLTLFRRLLGVDERDAPQTARQKIAGGLLLLDDGFKASLPLVFDFLGVPESPQATGPADPTHRVARLLGACVTLLRARAARRPTLLLIEDLHWLDPASEAFLRQLVEALAGTPVLPVLNFRPEYRDDWLSGDGYRRIALHPLADAAVDELLDELLGDDPSLDDLAARLRARAAGNPFFVEELVQSLVQSGALTGAKGAYRLVRSVDDAAIPTSVQAVLAARIDRLGERDKDVLQIAAVIGKQFTEPVLRAVCAQSDVEVAAALSNLAGEELVFEQAGATEREYSFKHPLTQEVAYGTQLASRRSRLHADVARALAEQSGEASGERAVLVAYHWERAGAVWEAAQWQYRAAHAFVGTDTREALARLRRVLALLAGGPQSPEAVTLALEAYCDVLRAGSLAGMPRAEGEVLFAAASALGERSGNRSLMVRVLSTYSEFLMLAGHSVDAQARLGEATALAEGMADEAVQLGVAMDRAQTLFWAGRLHEVLHHLDEVSALLERDGAKDVGGIAVGLSMEAFALALHGLCLSMMGRPREGAAELDRVIALSDAHESIEGRCLARVFRSLAALSAADMSVAVTHAHAALELATRADNPYIELMARAGLGYAYAYADRPEEAVALLQGFVDDGGGAGLGMLAWFMLSALGEAHRQQGALDTAQAIAERATALTRENGALTAECNAQIVLAYVLAQRHGATARPAVEVALARAEALIGQSGAESFRPRWHLAQAQCAILVGDAARAGRELRTTRELAEQLGMDELADLAARELAGLEGGEGA